MDHQCKTLKERRDLIRHQRDNWELLAINLNHASMLARLKYCPFCGIDLNTIQIQLEIKEV